MNSSVTARCPNILKSSFCAIVALAFGIQSVAASEASFVNEVKGQLHSWRELRDASNSALREGDVPSAIANYSRSLKFFPAHCDFPSYHFVVPTRAYEELTRHLIARSEFSKLDSMFDFAIDMLRRRYGSDSRLVNLQRAELATIYIECKQTDRALSQLKRLFADRGMEKIRPDSRVLKKILEAIDGQIRDGLYDEARATLMLLKEFEDKKLPNNALASTKVNRRLAQVSQSQGKFGEAFEYLRENIELLQPFDSIDFYLDELDKVASKANRKDEFQKVKEKYKAASYRVPRKDLVAKYESWKRTEPKIDVLISEYLDAQKEGANSLRVFTCLEFIARYAASNKDWVLFKKTLSELLRIGAFDMSYYFNDEQYLSSYRLGIMAGLETGDKSYAYNLVDNFSGFTDVEKKQIVWLIEMCYLLGDHGRARKVFRQHEPEYKLSRSFYDSLERVLASFGEYSETTKLGERRRSLLELEKQIDPAQFIPVPDNE